MTKVDRKEEVDSTADEAMGFLAIRRKANAKPRTKFVPPVRHKCGDRNPVPMPCGCACRFYENSQPAVEGRMYG